MPSLAPGCLCMEIQRVRFRSPTSIPTQGADVMGERDTAINTTRYGTCFPGCNPT